MARTQLIVGYIFYYRSVGKKKVDLVRRKSILYTGGSREFSVGQSRDKSFKSRGTGGGGRMMVDRSFSFNEFLLVFAPFTSSTLLY